jgi:hypothetical protein
MSRDLQVVALDSTLLLRFQGYSKIWSAVQSQAKLRSNDGPPESIPQFLINAKSEVMVAELAWTDGSTVVDLSFTSLPLLLDFESQYYPGNPETTRK